MARVYSEHEQLLRNTKDRLKIMQQTLYNSKRDMFEYGQLPRHNAGFREVMMGELEELGVAIARCYDEVDRCLQFRQEEA